LPFAVASRTCNHAHYDNGCQEPRGGANQISPTVASVSADGLTITISSIGGKPDQWAQFGEIVRVADGERRLVRSQIGTALVIDRRFLTLANGNALEVHAGCDHTVETCRDKFDNVTNFGGHPDLPVGNPTAPAGLGTIVQE
jgi:hypothetical protein